MEGSWTRLGEGAGEGGWGGELGRHLSESLSS